MWKWLVAIDAFLIYIFYKCTTLKSAFGFSATLAILLLLFPPADLHSPHRHGEEENNRLVGNLTHIQITMKKHQQLLERMPPLLSLVCC